ncbi:MAG: F0F1 ATP synthase subunit delta [Polyangiaceae bacterium]|nr:F0F1 ATP synthase subunit delta [Polyangiaceae bacterium]
MREVTIERATSVAGKMLLVLALEAVEQALRSRLLEEIARSVVGHGGRRTEGEEVELRCARMPDDAGMETLRAALAAALGRAPQLTVREDDALVAGIVVRIGDRVLDASIAGQLEVLRERARALLNEEAHG